MVVSKSCDGELGVTKVELFNFIRQEHFLHGKSVRQISKESRIHRRLIRQALNDAEPPKRKKIARETCTLTPSIKYFIDHWIQCDQKSPIKQRHTAHRIFTRLVEEHEFAGAEPTIRKYVGQRRRELLQTKEAFIIQVHNHGEEAEVDWYEAQVDFPKGRSKVYIFHMRACASGKEFHKGFLTQSQQAFFEGHMAAFEFFQGVFKTIRYDNLASAVKKVLQGRKREEHEKFILLKSHYMFESAFCRVGIRGAHEKGGVEGSVGRFRRNYLVPIPSKNDVVDLNKFLIECCYHSDKRKITGKTSTVESDWELERHQLLPLPRNNFSVQVVRLLKVTEKSLISFENNYYSLPVNLIDKTIEAQATSIEIVCYCDGLKVANHLRLYGKDGISMQLDHYLEALKYKPGAFGKSLVLQKTKENQEWPAIYEELWKKLTERSGEIKGTRLLIEILLLSREFGKEVVQSAIEIGLDCGFYDKDSILIIIRQKNQNNLAPCFLDKLEHLKQYERPMLDLSEYEKLLGN